MNVRKVDHLLYSIAWVEKEGSTWFERSLPQIAADANLNIIGANWAVPAETKPAWFGFGQSRIIRRDGTVLAKARSGTTDEIILADLPVPRRR